MSNFNDLSAQIRSEFAQKQTAIQKRERTMRIVPIVILIALIVFFTILQPSFLSFTNIRSLMNQLSIPLILSLGITFVILMGCIDLSIDGVMGMAAAFTALFVIGDKTLADLGIFGLFIPVIISAVIGLVDGFIHVKFRIPTFIATFAMSSIAEGIAMMSYQGVPGNIDFEMLKGLATGDIGGLIPFTFIVSMIVFLLMYMIQQKTAFGRYLYAVGDNESIAKQTGINVGKVKMLAFMLAGACMGLAGMIGAGKIARGNVTVGADQLFPAMTAVVLGGTSLSGGKGGVVNTLIGAIIVAVLQNGLVMLSVSSTIQNAIQGVIILAAVAMTTVGNKRQINK